MNDYEEWLENDYEEEDSELEYYEDEYNCYDEYENYNEYRSDFIKPLFFDELLTDFVNNLSQEEIKNILIQELKRDEEYTFNRYLQKEYKKYTSNKNNIYAILELINNRFYKLSHDYDYNYKDYTVKLLSKNDKEKISNEYNLNREIKRQIDRIFLNPELATYDDYKWIALFYKNNNTLKEIEDYCEKLKAFFDTLKHYSIKNTVPKSNVLIAMHILNDYTSEETAKLLIKNAKYDEFVDYIIENTKNIKLLYENFYDNVKNERYINKEKIAQIFYKFYLKKLDDEMYDECLYYNFLNSKDISYLTCLKNSENFEYYINKIIKNYKDVIILEKIYVFLNKNEELFNLLYKKENEYRLLANVELLKDDYNDELLKYFKERFYEVLANEKSRENYKKASVFITAINKLNNGEHLVNEIILQLKQSEYSKRPVLFEEINNAIK